jgi:acetoin utilization deacetylase AcuC-like enzyme
MFGVVYSKKFGSKGKNPAPKPAFETYESPNRALSIFNYLNSINLLKKPEISLMEPINLEKRDILRVHSDYMIKVIENLSEFGSGDIGNLVKAYPDILELAYLSAGSVVQLLKTLIDEEGKNKEITAGISINRPPGHHARRDTSEGLCLFNNIAIGIQYIRDVLKFSEKIAIIDIDAHFGNGTSSLFYEDPDVLHISLHESSFRGTIGMNNEIGAGKGIGTNINIRVPLGADDETWLSCLKVPEQLMNEFKPKIIIVAMGLDGHYSDPMGNLKLSSNAYMEFGKWIHNLQQKLPKTKVAFVLEGGYSQLILGRLIERVISPFLSHYTPQPPIDLLNLCYIPFDEKKRMKILLDKQNFKLKTALKPYWDVKL